MSDQMSLKTYENGLDNSEEKENEHSDSQLAVAFMKKRHTEPIEGIKTITQTWRMKERMKTVSVALVLCLNVGVDPPDLIKTQPCARMECWVDPLVTIPNKASEAIGNNLQKQYERWQPRARYKQTLDPTVDEVKKLCTSMRRNAKEERVLFHYNGHGVPRPTQNGEIWVFNKTYTQYIPLSVYDLQTWMGAPSIYVYDCSSAGTILESFKQFANQHEQEYEQLIAQNKGQYPAHLGAPVSFKNCIQLGACSSNQILPMNPELPADLFTSCLTSPIRIALRWFVLQNTSKLVPGLTLELIDKYFVKHAAGIPGQLNDRRTMLGELNWIFTAITDTIAWNTFSRELFQKLFRQDLLVASLFRNFLLAERIMRSYNCTPVSNPVLPLTNKHPMWQAWDLTLDICLTQLPGILDRGETFVHSSFFAEQLTAFQVWLEFGSDIRNPPEQLPIVLQVLLSQVHRLRALDLLGRFLDLGPWAVNLALSVGIFPYVLKLLQSSARELRPLLVFIWAKILAVDNTCQADLVRENGHKYFLAILEDSSFPAETRTLAAFVIACIVNNYSTGQEAARQGNLVSTCLEMLVDFKNPAESTNLTPLLRQWLAICLGRVWMDFDAARWSGVRDSAHEKLYTLLKDDYPEVRAAALFALGTFMSSATERNDHANTIDHSVAMTLVNSMNYEASPLVRQELVVALHWLVVMFENQFLTVAYQSMGGEKRENDKKENEKNRIRKASAYNPNREKIKTAGSPVNSSTSILSTSSGSLESSCSAEGGAHTIMEKIRRVSSSSSITSLGALICLGSPYLTVPYGSIYSKVWDKINKLTTDPHPAVSSLAITVIKYIKQKVTQALEQTKEAMPSDVSFSAPSSPSSKPSYLSGESPPPSLMLTHEGTRPSSAIHWNPGGQQRSISFFSSLTRPKKTSSELKLSNPASTSTSEDESQSNAKVALCSTEFVDWSCKYFSQSVMNITEENDPESIAHHEREWRYIRNDRIRRESKEEQNRAKYGRLDDQVFINRNVNVPSLIKFHPFEPVIAVADRDSHFSMWNWEKGARLSYLPNNNAIHTRITAMELLNSHDSTLILLGSDDGAVKVWRNVMDDGKNVQLVTAWQALGEMLPSNRGSGLVTEWDQKSCILYAAGDVRVIRLWDAEREMRIQDIPTGADSCVTSLSSSTNDQPFLVAGFGDGTIRVYDRRMAANDSRIMTYREHSCWVVNVQVQQEVASGVGNNIISGSIAGDVRFWDIRAPMSVMTCMSFQGMTAMSVHPRAGIFACGTANQFISVHTVTGEHLSLIKYYDGFMGQRIGPISCLDFHPYKVSLSAGATDCFISIYTIDKKR